MKTDPTFWLLARASGLTAYVLLTGSVLAGLTVKSKPLGRRLKAAAATDAHRFLALLAIGAVVLHGLVLTLDQTVKMPLAGLLVPGQSPYRPLATGFGVLAAELMVVIYASFSLRRRIGVRTWRRLHYLTFGVFAAATVHGVAAGTDTWALGLYTGSVAAVVGLTAWRVLTPSASRHRLAPSSTASLSASCSASSLTKGETDVPHRDRPVAV
jgi:sulfoxide reductase heme-binding subunit YedZ